jgi:ketopantoate hydroxymethyltransferase
MGMCVYGYIGGTIPVTMDQCIIHSEAVRRGLLIPLSWVTCHSYLITRHRLMR